MIVTFSSQARNDFVDTFETYEAAQPGLGRDFATQVERALLLAATYPESAPAITQDFRRAVVNRFPFCILYAALDSELYVAVLLVAAERAGSTS